jgi:hypothetical protein
MVLLKLRDERSQIIAPRRIDETAGAIQDGEHENCGST